MNAANSSEKRNTAYVIVDPLTTNNTEPMWCTRNNRRILKIIYIATAFVVLLAFVLFQIFPPRTAQRQTAKSVLASSTATTNLSLSSLFPDDDETVDALIHNSTITVNNIQRFVKNLRDPNDVRLLSKHINGQELTSAERRRVDELNEEFHSFNRLVNENNDRRPIDHLEEADTERVVYHRK